VPQALERNDTLIGAAGFGGEHGADCCECKALGEGHGYVQ